MKLNYVLEVWGHCYHEPQLSFDLYRDIHQAYQRR